MQDEPHRRTVLGAAWAAPVVAMAVAAPAAAASEELRFSMAWSPTSSPATTALLTLSIDVGGPAIVGGAPVVLTVAQAHGSEVVQLASMTATGSWVPVDPGVRSTSAVFTSAGLAPGASSVVVDATVFTGGPTAFMATVSRGSAVLATSPVVTLRQPRIEFDQPVWTFDPFLGFEVTGTFVGGTPPTTIGSSTTSFSTTSFFVQSSSVDPAGTFSIRIMPSGFELARTVFTLSTPGYLAASTQLAI